MFILDRALRNTPLPLKWRQANLVKSKFTELLPETWVTQRELYCYKVHPVWELFMKAVPLELFAQFVSQLCWSDSPLPASFDCICNLRLVLWMLFPEPCIFCLFPESLESPLQVRKCQFRGNWYLRLYFVQITPWDQLGQKMASLL